MTPRILLVEDNPITRKMVTFALAGKDFVVAAAPDGATAQRLAAAEAFDLVLQDVILPDIDGFDLVRRLRAVAGMQQTPILAFTGFLSKFESAQMDTVGFTDLVTKPIQPSQLLRIIRSHLPGPGVTPRIVGSRQRVVLADDDPVQRKLTAFRLDRMGFNVVSVEDGMAALEQLRACKPDVLVTDVMMPRLDGFGLCAAIRQEPALADLRVILISNTYIDPEDRVLAQRAGADQFVHRTPDLKGLADALEHVLTMHRVNAGAPWRDSEDFERARVHRALRQLERQISVNAGLTQQCSLLSAQLSILSAISEAIARQENVESVLREALAACFDAGGISAGALYLWPSDDAPPTIYQVGGHAEGNRAGMAGFFGHLAFLQSIAATGQTTGLSLSASPTDEVKQLLINSASGSMLIVPILKESRQSGALVMMSRAADLVDDDRTAFAQAVTNQISLALRLAGTFAAQEESEHKARSQAAIIQSVIDSIPDGLVMADATGRYMVWNAAAESIIEIGPVVVSPTERSTRFGLFLPDRVTPFPPDELPLARALRGEIVDRAELVVRNSLLPEGKSFSVNSRPLRSANGAIAGGVVTLHDLTEERALEAQLRQAQKLEAVGQLAGGVAHDFNNLLTVILGFARLVSESFGADDPRQAELEQVIKAGEQATTLTKQLLAFSRKQVLQPVTVDLNALVANVRQMLARLIGEHIDLATVLAPGLRPVRADPGQLEQILMNLVVNARDAMPTGGRVAIETANVELDRSHAMQHEPVRPGSYVMLAVTDHGAGMTDETKRRLFEPFFTTKEAGKGTGLGLATVYGIVKQSGGYIWVYSEPGIGTAFKVYFPVAEPGAAVATQAAHNESIATGTETILVVEDEDAVRFLTRIILEKAGYRVFDAANPRQAELLFGEDPTRFDMLVTDIVMPGSSGPRLFERLERLHRGLKVLYVSGYTDDAIAQQGELEPGVAFLQKPFTAGVLSRRVREVLAR